MNTIKTVDNQIEQFKTNRYDNIENALKYIDKAMEICKENDLYDKLQECRYHYASAQFDKGNWKESLRINMDIKRIIEERGEKYVTKVQIFLTLGIYNFNIGNFEISLEFYLEALEDVERKKDLENVAKLKINISEIYRKLGDYSKAKEYLDEILIYENNLNVQSLEIIYTNYAEILTEMKNFSIGLNFLDKSDNISKKIKDNIGLAYNAMLRGRIYDKQGKFKEAEEYFLESLSIFKKTKEGIYIFEAYNDYIKFLINRNKLDRAENIIKETFQNLDGKDSLITELTLERHLAIINYKRGKYKLSIDHFLTYDRIFGEYDIEIVKMRLLAVKTKFDIIKSQKEKNKIEKHSKELEEKYDVFETATEIIKEITSTLELKEIVSKVQKQLKQAIPLDVFGLALYDKEKGEITYEEYVEGDIGHGEDIKPIDVYSRKNFSAYVVRNNEDIHLRIMDDKSKFVDEIVDGITIEPFDRISETVVFKRLVFEDKILGILTVQSYKRDIYDSRHIAIIDLITPYLAIAVNNSIKSNKLIKEIKEREKTEVKLKEINDILRNISNTDNLTSLYNRHYLNKIMDGIFYKKDFEERIINLIMIDIDFFKEYNDTYGHVEGDKVIKQIGLKIKDICDDYNIDAFRYGGDEFLVIDFNLDKDSLRNLGKRINTDIKNLKIRNSKSPISHYVTISVGITQVKLEKSYNQNKLIKKVDNALYESKRVGRNRVVFI